jgi:hypothetical protein
MSIQPRFAETGLRLSEAVNLSRETIRLNAAVPHLCVAPEGRHIKTDESRREIPLVGVALMAMRAQPDGFPRYRDKADVLSALVNKALDARGLRPELGQSLYSLRHTFEDRLTAVDAPDKIIACLMGHKWSRPRYGVGPSLEHQREWLERIAFRLELHGVSRWRQRWGRRPHGRGPKNLNQLYTCQIKPTAKPRRPIPDSPNGDYRTFSQGLLLQRVTRP